MKGGIFQMMKKAILLIALVIAAVFSVNTTSFATGTVDAVVNGEQTEDNQTVTEDTSGNATESAYEFNPESVLPPVSMDQAEAKVNEKGSELLSLFQRGAAFLIAIFLVVGIVAALFGKFGKKEGAQSLGFGILIACAVAYVIVYIGPWALDWIRAWAIS